MQPSADDEAAVAEQMAQYLNLIRPADSQWRPCLTGPDIQSLSVDEYIGRYKAS